MKQLLNTLGLSKKYSNICDKWLCVNSIRHSVRKRSWSIFHVVICRLATWCEAGPIRGRLSFSVGVAACSEPSLKCLPLYAQMAPLFFAVWSWIILWRMGYLLSAGVLHRRRRGGGMDVCVSNLFWFYETAYILRLMYFFNASSKPVFSVVCTFYLCAAGKRDVKT